MDKIEIAFGISQKFYSVEEIIFIEIAFFQTGCKICSVKKNPRFVVCEKLKILNGKRSINAIQIERETFLELDNHIWSWTRFTAIASIKYLAKQGVEGGVARAKNIPKTSESATFRRVLSCRLRISAALIRMQTFVIE